MTGFFSSYIQSIAAVGICAFICEWICSSEKGGENIKKTVNLIASLCIAITVLLPFCNGMKQIFEDLQLDHIAEDKEKITANKEVFYDLTEKETEKSILEEICSEFGIKPLTVCIDLIEHEGVLTADCVCVELRRQDESHAPNIRAFLYEKGFESISVTYGDGENETY